MERSFRGALAALAMTVNAGTAVADSIVPPPPEAVPPRGETPAPAPVAATPAPRPPQRGDFDAGGQVRLPSGPDAAGAYATFNWIALDLKGSYRVLDWLAVNGVVPLAVKKPDLSMTGVEPHLIGGMTVTLQARLPELPRMPLVPEQEVELALVLTGGLMREGAMLLGDKDYPLYVGDLQPGLAGGVTARVRLSRLLDVALAPAFVYQAGSVESLTAIQLPTSTIVKLGSVLAVSADLGIYTGDDYALGGDDGGRIAAGGALDVKLGPVITHAGAGVASLLAGGLYPSIGDSFYVDLNVRFAK